MCWFSWVCIPLLPPHSTSGQLLSSRVGWRAAQCGKLQPKQERAAGSTTLKVYYLNVRPRSAWIGAFLIHAAPFPNCPSIQESA